MTKKLRNVGFFGGEGNKQSKENTQKALISFVIFIY